MKLFVAQLRSELQLVMRNGEQLLLTLGIPVILLFFFGTIDLLPIEGERIDFVAPGVLALAVMSTAMVSLGIATGFERTYLVLKRLGATPLGRTRLIAAKIASVLAVEIVQFAVLVPLAVALGWNLDGSDVLTALGTICLGSAAFAGLGLTLAGRLRGEINLAAQNGLYLLLLLLGGMVFPLSSLPGGLRHVAYGLPSSALADLMRFAMTGSSLHAGVSALVLAAWAIVTPAVAASTFRWS